MSIISEYMIKLHNENIPGAKFKIKEEVIYNPIETDFPEFRGKSFTISGVNCVDEDSDGNLIFEYSLVGFPFLVWEHEIEKAPQRFCEQCGAPKELYKCDHCGV